MLNFLRRDQRKLPLSLLTAWTLSSATLPWIIPALFALLIAGVAATLGNSFTDALFDFVSEISGDWLRLNSQLWLTAFFMMVVCYGVGKQLVCLTNRRSLCAPLAALAARGTSEIHNLAQIERGYQQIDERLRGLGAHIERVG